MVVPLYEVYLLGNGKPHIRLTNKTLKVGDVIDFGNRAWRVRTVDAGENGVSARFICIPDGSQALREGTAKSNSRANGTVAVSPSDKLGVLRNAAARAARQRAKKGPAESAGTQPPA